MLKDLFSEDLVWSLSFDSQRDLFEQVADLLEDKGVVKESYREALIAREADFPTGLDMEFLGKNLPNVAIPHTDTGHCLTENVAVVRLDKPITFRNMIAPTSEVEVSLLFFIINSSNDSQTGILSHLMDFFTSPGNLEGLAKLESKSEIYNYLLENIKN